MTILTIEPNTTESANDPNWTGKLNPGEAFTAGNYGTLVFDVATGAVLRYYISTDGPEYLDIVKIDVERYRTKPGERLQEGGSDDIIFFGFWTIDGEYVEPAEPDPASRFIEEFGEALKRMYGIELNDTGFTETDLRKWYAANEDATACAKTVGEESDLDRIDLALTRPYGGL